MPTNIEGIKVYTLHEAAKEVGVTAQTFRQYVKRNLIEAVKVAGIIIVTEKALNAFLNKGPEASSN